MNKTTSCMMALLTVSAFCGGRTLAGTLDAPAAVNSSTSAMWTLNDIYNVLDTRTTNVARRTTVFTEPTNGPTVGTMHNLNDIMALVTNRAAVAKTGQNATLPLNPAPAGSDGALRLGVAWPNPRFTIVGDTNAVSDARTNCVRDNLTGLIWARNMNLASNTIWTGIGTCTWVTAFAVITNSAGPVNGANYGGTNDWRMPNWNELTSLITVEYSTPAVPNIAGTAKCTEGNPFFNILPAAGFIWSSSSFANNTGFAWSMPLGTGQAPVQTKTGSSAMYVWPVRGP